MKRFILLLIFLIANNCRSTFLYHPTKEMRILPIHIGLGYRDVFFMTSDKLILHGWFIKSKKNYGTVIFNHGNAGNISNRYNTIRIINELGFNLFIYDYRGYGKSQGTSSFEGLKKDSLAAWDYVVNNLEENPNRIIIWGRSLGGSVAAFLASQKPCKILIIESTFISLNKIAGDLFFMFPYIFFIGRNEYNTLSYLEIVKCPVLVIHSLDDEVIPFDHGIVLLESLRKNKMFVTLRGPHNFGFMISQDLYLSDIDYFLKKHFFTD